MKVAFISNFLTLHQLPLAEELYKQTNGNYRFVETIPMPGTFDKGGYADYSSLPWLIQLWKGDELKAEAYRWVQDADVVVSGGALGYLNWLKNRLDLGKLCFEMGERWLKRGWLNILSPRFLKWHLYYRLYFHNKLSYYLAASGFSAGDLKKLHSYSGRTFKWGYFTRMPEIDIEKIMREKSNGKRLRCMHLSRMLKLKHQELVLQLAQRLKALGYDFEINMYGSGPELKNYKTIMHELGVGDVVNFCGNIPNTEVFKEMQMHHVFLFTSDRNEGWGAVINEAMSNGCAVVCSDAVGSAPFLIKEGVNGLTFRSCDVDSLTEKVKLLFDNPRLRNELSVNAYRTMKEVWSPANAASQFLKLSESLLQGKNPAIIEGPCSVATPI